MSLNGKTLLTIVVAATTMACGDRNAQKSRSDSAVDQVSTSSRSVVPPPAGLKIAGVRLISDSAVTAPILEVSGNEYLVRIPQEMAAVLNDTLPGFTPLSRSAFDPALVRSVDAEDSSTAPLSVVIGDFNGDARPDIAMIGTSGDRQAKVILVAKSGSSGKPLLYFIGPERKATPEYPEFMYLQLLRPSTLSNGYVLRSDGVRLEIFDKAETLYYLDKGVLREAFTSGD